MLVSPINPLKDKKGVEDYDLRVEQCEILTKNTPFIKVSTFEQVRGVNRTADTIRLLKKQYPKDQFIWLMGSENWQNFHNWYGWENIMEMVPIASFYRDEKSFASLKSPATSKFKCF